MSAELSVDTPMLHAALVRWLTDDAHQGLFATDPQFRIVSWNRWMEIHSGHSADQVTGQSLFDLYPDAGTGMIREYYEGARQGRVTIVSHGLHRYLLPLPPTHPDLPFDRMPQSGHIGPLLHDGRIIGTVTSLENVSERLAAERELRKQIEAQRLARTTAEEALRAKDDFLSTLSHEIRTPLNAVLGWARILLGRQEIDRAMLDRAVSVIERNAAAQAKLIDDMLDMARIAAGKLRLDMQSVDLVSVIVAAVDVVAPAAVAKSLKLRTDLDQSAPSVSGDPDRLQQIVWNLLSNALKFTDPGGAIDVVLETAGPRARIVVRDTGRGIAPEFLPHVFERFRQSDASSTRRSGGLGLGLGLVRELVALHGGTVRAESPGEGHGATFTVELPATSAVASAAPERPVVGGTSLAGVRVLLIEDDADARDLTRTALEQYGAEVTSVSSAPDAVAAILAASDGLLAHVIVSDIGMPGQDGYGMLREIRALAPERGGRIPAITVTGYTSPDDVQRATSAGFQMHMAKPVDPASLVAAVAALAARGRA